MNFKRNNDLQEIFDQKYEVNYNANNNVRQEKERQDNFNKRMFGMYNKQDFRKELRNANTPTSQVNNLKQRMDAANTFNRNNFGG
jgi:hypothetical protein